MSDSITWRIPCPKCSKHKVFWVHCYATEKIFSMKPLGIRIICADCKYQGPIKKEWSNAVRAWIRGIDE